MSSSLVKDFPAQWSGFYTYAYKKIALDIILTHTATILPSSINHWLLDGKKLQVGQKLRYWDSCDTSIGTITSSITHRLLQMFIGHWEIRIFLFILDYEKLLIAPEHRCGRSPFDWICVHITSINKHQRLLIAAPHLHGMGALRISMTLFIGHAKWEYQSIVVLDM